MRAILITVLTLACLHVRAQFNSKNLTVETSITKYRYQNLHLYPIRAGQQFLNHNRSSAGYKPLKDALQENKLKITEVEEGDVNHLFMQNTSKDTIMILSGEVVQGGKQDRMVANDVILYPKTKTKVDVFCVEHGRWTENNGDKSFKSYYTISSKEVRKAATVTKDQSEVWDKVAETTKKNKASSSTGTLTALQKSEVFNATLKRYVDHFAKAIVDEPNVIGVIAVTGDNIMGCDMFASHDLFAKHYINLVNSYASEAITNGKAVQITSEKVNRYLLSLIADESNQEQEVNQKGTVLKNGNKKIHISTLE